LETNGRNDFTSRIIYNFGFLNYRDATAPVPAPEFVVKQIIQPRFIVLFEETGNMNLRVRLHSSNLIN